MGSATRASSKAQVNRDDLECVQGQIVFGRRSPEEKAPSVVVPNYEAFPMVTYDVTIRSAGPIVDELSLDKEGFVLVKHKTSCADVRDQEVMRDKYLDEMAPFIKSYFNASWVVPSRGGLRLRRAAGNAIPKNGWNTVSGVREPAGMAHVDYAPVSAAMSAAAENQERGIPIRPYSRLMIIQIWRALSSPPQDIALAFCDASTVGTTDVTMADYVVDTTSENPRSIKISSVHFNPAHRWYYFPEMTVDEVVLFKGYDSEEHYKTQPPHSAFDNRLKYPEAITRESVEARFYVYFD